MILQRITTNRTAATRIEFLNNVEHVVVPCVAITEGVHEGSNGPLYYPAEELAKVPAVWNAKPVVIYHPTRNGQGVSACDPEIINTRGVGVMMNTRYEPGDGKDVPGKLHTEAWCEVSRIGAVDERLEEAINNNTMMELSTGLFTDNIQTPGEFRGKKYDAIATNYRPDHLALLPDVTGACSIADGAGFLRLNHAKQPIPKMLMGSAFEETVARMATNAKALNLSFDQMHRIVRNAVVAAYKSTKKDDWGPYVEDLFPEYVVFNQNEKLYRQNYMISNGVATLSGTADEVIRVVDYQKTGTPVGNAQQESGAMKKEEIVASLIANTKSGWKETDKDFLLSLSDERLGLIANAAKADEKPAAEPPKPTGNAKPEETPAPAKVVTDAEYIANAPPGLRDMMQDGLALAAAERARLTGIITANKKNTFTVDYLAAQPMPIIRNLAALAAEEPLPNYAGAATPVGNHAPVPATEAAYVMPTINWKE